MQYWLAAAMLAACWPLLGSAGGTAAVRVLGLPPIFLAPLVFAAGSLASYVILWAYFCDPLAGHLAWALLIIANGSWLVDRWRRVEWRRLERDAWMPFALTALVTIGCLGCLAWPGVSPPHRFTIPLPVADHLVPQLFAERLARGIRQEPRPLALLTTFGLATQTSDRPPLQAAVALAAWPAWPVSAATLDTTYQTVATLCQVTVLPALLALAAALELSRRDMRFIVIAVTCSGFFLANAVYPWPKLYAAALVLTALALLVNCTKRHQANTAQAAGIGGLAALALLAHGSPVFSLLAAPVLIAWASVRRLASPGRMMCAACAAVILLGPWLAYQRFFDPPGTRLVKIHLAGQLTPDDRPLLDSILTAYRTVDRRAWLHGRVENLRMQGFGNWRSADLLAYAQESAFFRQVPALGLTVVGLFGLAGQRRRRAAGLTMAALVGYSIVAWALWMVVMVRSGSASVHHGSYAITLVFLMGGAVGLAGWKRLGPALLVLHVVGFAAVWLVPRAGIPVLDWKPHMAVVMVAATLAAVALCRVWLRDDALSAREDGVTAAHSTEAGTRIRG